MSGKDKDVPPLPPVVKRAAEKIAVTVYRKLKDPGFLRDKLDEISKDKDENSLASKSVIDLVFEREKLKAKIRNFLAKVEAMRAKKIDPSIEVPEMWFRDP